MSSLPADAQANSGDGAGSTASPQRTGAFNRFIIGSPAQLPIPQDGSPSSESDPAIANFTKQLETMKMDVPLPGTFSLLESQLAAQTALIAQLVEKKEPVQLPQAQEGASQTAGEDAFQNAKRDPW